MPRLKAVSAVVACATLAVAVPVAASAIAARTTPATSPDTTPTLPRQAGLPWVWTPSVQDSPAGSAAVLFGGDRPPLTGLLSDDTVVAVVGAQHDSYRLVNAGEFLGGAGTGVLLSGDGSRVAYGQAALDRATAGIRVVDLRTGRVDVIRAPDRTIESFDPVAWAPDGRSIAVWQGTDSQEELGMVDLTTRAYRRLGPPPSEDAAVAFAPEGTRVAYQTDGRVRVSPLDGGAESQFAVPAGSVVAGKGAWLSDARTLALVAAAGDDTRRLQLLDTTSGRITDAGLPAVPGVTTIRVLGWRPGGEAWVAAYVARADTDELTDDPFDSGRVRQVRVLSLRPGATTPETLLTPSGANSVDVATAALTTTPRAGADAPLTPVPPRWAATLAFGLYLLALLMFLTVRAIRRRRTNSP
jgi:hypothetical protein